MMWSDWRACRAFLVDVVAVSIVVAGMVMLPFWAMVQLLMWCLTTGG